jgi:hypothetical protein
VTGKTSPAQNVGRGAVRVAAATSLTARPEVPTVASPTVKVAAFTVSVPLSVLTSKAGMVMGLRLAGRTGKTRENFVVRLKLTMFISVLCEGRPNWRASTLGSAGSPSGSQSVNTSARSLTWLKPSWPPGGSQRTVCARSVKALTKTSIAHVGACLQAMGRRIACQQAPA